MDGINGIDTAKTLREKKEETVIIFITGIKEYVFEAFDVAAFHYLLKHVMEEKFFRVLERAAEEVKKHHRQEPLLISMILLFCCILTYSVVLLLIYSNI